MHDSRFRARALVIARGTIPPGARRAGADASTVADVEALLAARGPGARRAYGRLLARADVLSRAARGAGLARLDADEAERLLRSWLRAGGRRAALATGLVEPVKTAFYGGAAAPYAALVGAELVDAMDGEA
jgi:hypothetical protein